MIIPRSRVRCVQLVRAARFCSSLLLIVLFTAHTPALAQTRDPGIGGTGLEPGEGNGIGGTGNPANGGPGIGGTGIIGTITGFGSILVNGYEIEYSPEQTIDSDLGSASPAADLRIGQVVAVEAEGSGDRLNARTIAVQHAVSGRIDAIDANSGTLVVLGQTVLADSGVIADREGNGISSLSDLRVGDRIEVSGFRRDDGVIAASLIETAVKPAPDLIRGTVTALDSRSFAVSGYRLPLARNPANHPAIGELVVVTGSPTERGLVPHRIERVPETPFGAHFTRISIEGFVRRGPAKGLSVGGMALAHGLGGAVETRLGERVIVNGAMDIHRRFVPVTIRPAHTQFGPGKRGEFKSHGGGLPKLNRATRYPIAPEPQLRRRAEPHDRGAIGQRWSANRRHWWARRRHRD